MSNSDDFVQNRAFAAVKPFARLIGDWATESTHRLLPGTKLVGHVTFGWISGERFVIWKADNDDPRIPSSLSVVGIMEGDEHLSQQYFDSRGVHRIYRVTFDGTTLVTERKAPGFNQRLHALLSHDGSMLAGVSQLDANGSGYVDDLSFTYRRLAP
ncbi:MAG TPA: hypothetical protein VHA70_06030 [Bauldia sp.]|nr:hypothetical protein [Bauldia sp.]